MQIQASLHPTWMHYSNSFMHGMRPTEPLVTRLEASAATVNNSTMKALGVSSPSSHGFIHPNQASRSLNVVQPRYGSSPSSAVESKVCFLVAHARGTPGVYDVHCSDIPQTLLDNHRCSIPWRLHSIFEKLLARAANGQGVLKDYPCEEQQRPALQV